MARGAQCDLGKERFWRRMLRSWRGSGQTVRDFCAKHQLSEPSFYAWRRTVGERDRKRAAVNGRVGKRRPAKEQSRHVAAASTSRAGDQALFLPVRVLATTSSPPSTSTALELVVGAGRVVRVAPGFDPATLRQLLAVLEEAVSC